MPRNSPQRLIRAFGLAWCVLGHLWTSTADAGEAASSSVKFSDRITPHFETIEGRQVLYVEGRPHVILAAEIPWWHVVRDRYQETLCAYDYLYPAARKLGLNALKVPIRWSVVEPEPGRFDFSYVDHAKNMAEQHGLKLVLCWFGHHGSSDGTIYYNLSGDLFAPIDVVRDDQTYPRAIDADGVVHHNAASYEHDPIIRREIAAFRAFMEHIRRVDADSRTVLMVQVENEIAIFGWDRRNPKFWRDHSTAANRLFAAKGFREDLRYSAWRLNTNWIKPVTDAGRSAHDVPLFLNFVDGVLAEGMVGGAPGEDVATCLDSCAAVSFIGGNLYPPADSTTDDLRAALKKYQVGRNIVAITECSSDATPTAPRLAFLAIAEFGAPLFAPWCLTVSAPTPSQPYVQEDGALANGATALSNCYQSLAAALPVVAYYAGTDKLRVFMPAAPNKDFHAAGRVNGTEVDVRGWNNGQVIVVQPRTGEFIVAGYRCHVSIPGDYFTWPGIQELKVERGRFLNGVWKRDDEAYYGIDQSNRKLNLYLEVPQAIRVTLGGSGAELP